MTPNCLSPIKISENNEIAALEWGIILVFLAEKIKKQEKIRFWKGKKLYIVEVN